MKKLILPIIVASGLFGNSFKVGTTVTNFQDNEGSGITFGYKISNDLLIETSYNEYYLRAVKKTTTKESWSSYNTATLGFRYYLNRYANDQIGLFASAGIEHVYDNSSISSKTPELNTYFLGGVDFDLKKDFNLYFTFGSGGKGNEADKFQGEPSYAHGFISKLGVEYNF